MPKRTPDIVFEDAVPHTKHVRQNYGFGTCGWDGGWDVPTEADLMDEELMLQAREERRRMEMDARVPDERLYLPAPS